MTVCPVVEVMGQGPQNKGDAMMLDAIYDRLHARVRLAASPALGLSDPRLLRVRHGAEYRQEFFDATRRGDLGAALRAARNGSAMALMPAGMARARNAVPGRAVRAILDCSGFAYGDQWTTPRIERRTAYYATLKGRGAKLVMMPQALGPFRRPEMRAAAKPLMSQFDLVFARDTVSQEHVLELGLDPTRVRTVPDITHLLAGKPPKDPSAWTSRACIVPNARMLDKAGPEAAARYIDFLATCIKALRGHGVEPWLVLHESNDHPLVPRIQAQVGIDLPVLDEDALATKGVLGACRVAVSSRFHAIVSCLSQGVPVIGTAWTHKYEALFGEYGSMDLLASPADNDGALVTKIDALLNEKNRQAVSQRLSAVAERNRNRLGEMWSEIERILFSGAAAPGGERTTKAKRL